MIVSVHMTGHLGVNKCIRSFFKDLMSLDNSTNLGLRIFSKSDEKRVFLCCTSFSKVLSLR